MRKRHQTKLVHEGQYVAEVDVELVDTGDGWSPYLSLEDAYKLDDVREVVVWWPCSIEYVAGEPWADAPAGEDENYCSRNPGTWFPAGFNKRMGVIAPQKQ